MGCGPGGITPQGWATVVKPLPGGLTADPAAPTGVFWLHIATANVTARTSGGQLWDEVGGFPDPYVVLLVDGKEVMRTDTATDTLNAKWTGEPQGNLEVSNRSTMRVHVRDDDAINDVPIGGASFGPPSVSELASGEMHLDIGNRGKVTLEVSKARAMFGLGFDYEIIGGNLLVGDVIKHSPAGRAGMVSGDAILNIEHRKVSLMKPKEMRSAINRLGTKPVAVIVKRHGGNTEKLTLSLGPMYPLYAERPWIE